MNSLPLYISVFLACAVECVEATTIVLAAGTARDWKSSLLGTASAFGLLGVVVALLGPSISSLPIDSLRLFVGTLLLVFGLQWLRKAILRSSGYKSLHDEDEIFQEELEAARKAKAGKRFGVVDWYAFTLSFKGVLLEGLEVVFIVLTFGSIQGKVRGAAIAALAAVIIVAISGAALRKPLARVPENTMKYIVGIMCSSFGIFWGAEGAGVIWPHTDASLPIIAIFLLLLSQALIKILRTLRMRYAPAVAEQFEADELDAQILLEDSGSRNLLRDFFLFWYDFLVGDDLIGFAIVVGSLEITNLLVHGNSNAWWLMPIAVAIALPVKLLRVARA